MIRCETMADDGYGAAALAWAIVLSLCGCATDADPKLEPLWPSLGCESGTLDEGVTHVELVHDGRTRSYELHLPPAYDGVTALPVVLNFHGYTSSGTRQQESSRMDATADRKGFIVAYPNGLDASWNAGVCCGKSAEEDVDDVAFTRAVIEDLAERGCIDRARVYATGMSNGGFLSHRLACEASDVIAAVAPVAGVLGIDASACAPTRPTPVMHFHGTGDVLVRFDGGGLVASIGVEESTAGWLERNGCEGAAEVSYQNGDATCETVDECDAGVRVTLCTIEGAGHCWPGQPCPLGGDPTFDIDANEAMWEFFRRAALP
jgi:polyhydroxybutyrate depolymerase